MSLIELSIWPISKEATPTDTSKLLNIDMTESNNEALPNVISAELNDSLIVSCAILSRMDEHAMITRVIISKVNVILFLLIGAEVSVCSISVVRAFMIRAYWLINFAVHYTEWCNIIQVVGVGK